MDDPVPSSSSSVGVAFPGAQSAGDLNVVIVGWSSGSSTVKSVTDTAGNTYVQAVGTQTTGSVSQAIFYAKNIAASASNTVTVAFNQATPFPDVRIFEYSGVDTTAPLDVTGGVVGSSSPATISVTTTAASDVVVVGGTTSGGFGTTGTGFTVELFNNSTSDIAGDKFPVTPGTFTGSDTSSGAYVLQAAAFGSAPTAFTAPTLNATTPITPNAGSDTGNQGVKISGSNFAPGAVVLFGNGATTPPSGVSGVNCRYISAAEIDCSTPAHTAGTVDVIVMNPDGQFASATGAFTFDAVIPVISSVTFAAGSNTTNGNTSITINGSNFVAPATVTIGGQRASNVSVVSATKITANAPAGPAGPADVSVKNGDGGGPTTLAGGYTYVLGTGPVNFIQRAEKSYSTQSVSSVNVPLPSAATAGDLEVVIIGWGDTVSAVSGVTDDAGNNYAQALAATSNPGKGLSQTIYYAKNVKSNTSITVTFNRSAVTPDIRVLEYSGLDPASPLDTNPASANFKIGSGTVADSGPVTTTFNNNLIIGAAMVSQSVISAGGGFTVVTISANGNDAQHQINGNAVSGMDPSATLANGTPNAWVMQAVTFHAPTNVAPPSFTLDVSAPSAVNPGSSASSTITVTPQNGFSAAVALSCTAPANAGIGCSITPKSVTPSGGAAQATLTITTTGPTAALMVPRNGRSLLPLYAVWLPLPGIALAGIGFGSRRRNLGLGMLLFLVLAFTLLLFGCGGGGSSSGGGGGGGGGGTGGTAAGSYNITVTATSAGVSNQQKTVSLTVN